MAAARTESQKRGSGRGTHGAEVGVLKKVDWYLIEVFYGSTGLVVPRWVECVWIWVFDDMWGLNLPQG